MERERERERSFPNGSSTTISKDMPGERPMAVIAEHTASDVHLLKERWADGHRWPVAERGGLSLGS